ncbi:MAG: T9SS type A sorting domain-containing protein [Ignavibacteriota bacterium]|nr:T9SS type A sorting domain-containing protein [Ignavibacteriales bacterium]MBL1123994.1 T9SS C-terminal target domain-containing protein [Ignavibacteriota bacterium]MCC7093496.1 T9SS type A sorting domain-containing protein [Ignavibacteriaceae bacterium]MCE7857272.1 T9SS C-terminal target domain-containing protein [Ignavibacteria bacterium CHB3]QKJ94902.1 MAG: T9SS type A sorting domain-containing protein [Ignavibacteriota bacterium]
MPLRNKILALTLTSLLFFAAADICSQPFHRELNLIPVSDGSGLIKNNFSGGHNNLEYQFVDIDNDEDLDIFFLDSDKTFGLFENIGNKFNPEYKYLINKPNNLFFSNWFYFVDIDNDNDFDYFTGNNDQISYYQNNGSINSPSFILVQDTVWDDTGQPIYSEFGSNALFADIDNDDDLDFFSGNSAGTVKFYENIGTQTNFNFKFITNEWQNLYIVGTLAENSLHGASSLDFIDINDDDDLDLFWGDFFSNSLYFIENQGNSISPDMQKISDVYPINSDSVNTSGFNMPRFTDIDSDGDYDLFVSVLYDPTVPQSLMFYENTGNAQSANHILRTNDFLKTLDVGNNSSPVFVDIDNDGDLDLFIGSFNNPNGSIHFLENTGTVSNPSFYYSDSQYFNIMSDLVVTPAFGDLDNDGDYDLLAGKLNGTIDFYLNNGTPVSANFQNSILLRNNNNDSIDVGSSSSPFLMDVDGDSDLDLAIGGFNGKLSFYENTGNPASYEFTSNPAYFGTLDIGDNSTPFFIDYNEDDVLDLFSGSRNGEMFYFRNDGNNISPIWSLITNQFIHDNFGGNTFPCFFDIDNDTDSDLFLGNVKGGLYFYLNSMITSVAEWELTPVDNYSIATFPNPFNPSTRIKYSIPDNGFVNLSVYNLLGEKIAQLVNEIKTAGEYESEFDGSGLASGVYIAKLVSNNNHHTIKMILTK